MFLGASSFVMCGITDPETLEALACREGLALAVDLNLRKLRVASDCSNVIGSLTGVGFSQYGHIVKEIRARAAGFVAAEFVYENRSSNIDAHSLARSSISVPVGRHLWLQSPPDCVSVTRTIE